jgi:hypothetical protein
VGLWWVADLGFGWRWRVLWMSCFGFVDAVCVAADGFGLWGWKNGFGVGGLWCFGGGSGWSVVAGVGVLMLVNLEC